MASPESIDLLLRLATRLLDRAAGEIRDAQLQPVRANVTQIGKALAEIYEINAVIHESHPHLRPAYLDEPSLHPESNRRLTIAMVEAGEHEESGNLAGAIATLRAVLEIEREPLHREIAQGEIERLHQRKRQ